MVHSGLCDVYCVYLVQGLTFKVGLFFCWFCDYELFLGFWGMVLQCLNLGSQFRMGIKKIKVHTLTNEGTSPKCIGTMRGGRRNGESLADLRLA